MTRARVGVGLAAAAAAFALVLLGSGAAAGSGGLNAALTLDNGSSFETYDASSFADVNITDGTFDFVPSGALNCTNGGLPDGLSGGVLNNNIFSADIYVVPAGSVTIGSALHNFSGPVNTVTNVASGGAFADEFLGNAVPQGFVVPSASYSAFPPGKYAIVYDECQDGVVGIEDAVFDPIASGNTEGFEVVDPSAPTNAAPTAAFTHGASTVGDPTFFTDQSSDSDGSVVSWLWSFGDGSTSTAQSPSHTYAAPGPYAVTLTVTDNGGATASASQNVLVQAPNANAPVANFSFTPTGPVEGDTVSFIDMSTDADANMVGWSWDFGDGSGSTQRNPTHVFAAGTWSVTLTVTDSTSLQSSTQEQIVVAASTGNHAPIAQNGSVAVDPGVASPVRLVATDGDNDPLTFSIAVPPAHGTLVAGTTPGDYTYTSTAPYVGDDTFQFTANDGTVDSNTATFTVHVRDPATGPKALFDPQGSSTNLADSTTTPGATVSAFSSYCCGGHDPAQMLDNVIGLPWAAYSSDPQFATIKLARAGYVIDRVGVQPRADCCADQWVREFAVDVSDDGVNFTNVLDTTTQQSSSLQFFNLPKPVKATYVRYRPLTNWNFGCCYLSTSRFTVQSGGVSGRDVHFANASSNAVLYQWDFGDGGTSTAPSPNHHYAAQGTYTVTLTATSADGRTDTYSAPQTVAGPSASFSTDPASSTAGFPVTFTDATTEAEGGRLTSWSWDFGDGTTSTAESPVHTFAANGTYTVRLVVTDSLGLTDTATRTYSVGAAGAGPIALFDPQVNGGAQHDVAASAAGGQIFATSTSRGTPAMLIDGVTGDQGWGDQWWSSDRSPSQYLLLTLAQPQMVDAFKYLGPGCGWYEMWQTFDVLVSTTTTDPSAFTTVLHATTQCVGSWQTFALPRPYLAKYVKAVPTSPWTNGCCYSAVDLQVVTGADSAQHTVTFQNRSQNATSYTWDFGDGSTSTDPSPTHTYSSPGSYTVTLTATGPGGTATYSATQTVRDPDFTWAPSSPQAGDYVQFTDASPALVGAQVWSWSFGDGGTSTVRNPTHVYAAPGTYSVTLTTTDDLGATATATKSVTVGGAAVDAFFTPQGDGNAAQLETGASVLDVSSMWNGDHSPQAMLDRYTDPYYLPWATGSGRWQTNPEFAKIALAPGGPWVINHVDVMPRPWYDTQRVKHFQVWVSSTTADDSAFHKVLDTQTENNGSLQRFDLPRPVLARYLLYKPIDNWGNEPCCISTQQLRASTGQISGLTVTFSNLSRGATSYSWDFGDGTSSTAATPTHTYAAGGDYTVTLTASDGTSTSSFSLVQHVLAPLTGASLDATAPFREGQAIPFTASVPSLPPGGATYHWVWGDGASNDTTSPTITHIYGDNGSYTASVTITDIYGRTVSPSTTVAVANVAPSIDLGPDFTMPEHTFLAQSYSYGDPGSNESLTCDVDYGDGSPVESGACWRLYHKYPAGARTYTVKATIHDKDGASSSDTVHITTQLRAQAGYAATDFVDNFPGSVFPAPLNCCGPIGLTFDSTNHLYVSDYPTGDIYRFDESGGAPDNAHKLPNNVGCHPSGLAFSKSGRLYVARQACSDIVEIDPTTGATLRTVATGIPCVTGLATDPISGDLIGTTVGCDGYLYRINPGETGPVTVSRYTGWIGAVDGVTIGPDGTMWLELQGWLARVAGTNQPDAGTVTQVVSIPWFDGVAISASSDPSQPSYIYANRNDGIITKIDLSTATPTLTDIYKGGTRGDFVAVGPDGCLYATQSDEVVKVTFADGTCGLASTSVVPQLGLTPQNAAAFTGSPHTVTATLTNVVAPQGTVVAFHVSGANTLDGTGIADANGVVQFSYTGANEGTDTISATTTVGTVSVQSNSAHVTWTKPPNSPPVAADVSLSTPEDAPLPITLTATDVDGNTLAFTHGAASHGTLTGSGAALTYTPDADYNGPDSFTYSVSDGIAPAVTATVKIDVTPVNDPPVASPLSLTTAEDTPVAGQLHASDVDGDPLVWSPFSPAGHGRVDFGPDGSFSYTPDANFNGADAFVAVVSDGQGGSALAEVDITVTPVNDAPTASDVSSSGPEDTPQQIHVSAADVDGDALSYAASPASHGTVTGSGPDFTYTPAANYNGPDAFDVTVSDGNGGSTVAHVAIDVTPVNDPPTAPDVSSSGPEDTPQQIHVTASDVDGDGLSYSATQPAHGAVTGSGPDFTYTPAANYNGPDAFDVTVSDGNGGSTVAHVSITVTPVNDPPTTSGASAVTDEDTPVGGTLAALDVDGDPLVFALASDPQHGHATVGLDGSFQYVPDPNYNGVDAFAYFVSDGNGGFATGIVNLTIRPVNDPPAAVDDSATTNEDQPVTLSALTANDTDVDGDALAVVQVVAGPATHGTVALSGGDVVYTPETHYFGPASFDYVVSDGHGGTSHATVHVTVLQTEHAPTAEAIPPASVDEGSTVALHVDAADVDGDPLTYTWSTDVGSILGTGPNATLAADDGPSTAHVSVTVSDGTLSVTRETTVSVRNVAPAPHASAAPATTPWGVPVTFTASATDPSAADAAAGFDWAWSFGATTAVATSGFPTPGTYTVGLRATDKDGGNASTTVGVTVTKRPTSIVFTAPLSQPFGPTELSARLVDGTDPATGSVGSRVLTFTAGGRTFSATTGTNGVATVTPAPFLLSGPVTVAFGGNALYTSSRAAVDLTIENAFGGPNGFFTLGDRTATGGTVSFWTSQWQKLNTLSGGAAPAQFKGFVDALAPTGCAATWTSRPGNSSAPPASIGPYLAVVVTTRVSASGSSIAGTVTHVLAVKTAPGYGPAPGHDGTGQVVGTVC